MRNRFKIRGLISRLKQRVNHKHLWIYACLLPALPSHALTLSVLSDQLNAPWALTQEPKSGQILITEKAGRVLSYDMLTSRLTSIAQIPNIQVNGQGGLMDIALSPDFNNTNKLFFSYAKQLSAGSATTLASAVLNTSTQPWSLNQWQDLLVTQPASDNGRHFGSRIAFDDGQHVFFSIGDRGKRENAQDLSVHPGSIVRLNLDGTVPDDNPFVDIPNARPEIYSYGHRNPQGLVYINESKQLLSIEHGPRGGDELNLIRSGINYGWPIISYGKEYWGPIAVGEGTHKANMQQPLMQYTPSIAPSSLLYYQHNYYLKFKNSFLTGSLALRHLNQLNFNQPLSSQSNEVQSHIQTRWLQSSQRRIRDIEVLQDGRLVLISDRGELLLLER